MITKVRLTRFIDIKYAVHATCNSCKKRLFPAYFAPKYKAIILAGQANPLHTNDRPFAIGNIKTTTPGYAGQADSAVCLCAGTYR